MNATPVEVVADSDAVEVLGLHCRITNRLRAASIFCVGDLCRTTARDLMKLPGFGTKSLHEVEAALQRAGRSLRAEEQRS
ncbi:DNA-directed RNA polymerase subunit alpha C-terminal domain-containing protein [Paraburkholderia humisilvae]|uniref:DNA-directed RNA polymerase subunit alpha n=1 Tax=Paraburkholderia humisilvae TaxID=627669 RepID=A0A6J5E022_9BURK|nr:DNA-directed RNA polymerase subunit alpha C-terminal domain-containing protein [Paraburkholderia humisilvae]CAB3758485.1 DNA-directed RNA polymerase subunit alpha [Paraburkholderia humisilvae]